MSIDVRSLALALHVLRKELRDALRDRRTLATVLLSAVLLGPLTLLAMSMLVASLEAQAEQRELRVAGLANAPSLRNYVERQTWRAIEAPADYVAQHRDARLADPVVLVPADFESALRSGEAPLLEVVFDSANTRSRSAAGRVEQLLSGFVHERALLALALRGISPELLEPVRTEVRDLASSQSRATQITGLLPFFVLMAVLYGALNAALDTTAGERERGSLEPLLMNPAPPLAVVLGKWGAVAIVSMLIAVLSCFSFLPGQWVLRSDTLAALFQYGPREAGWFVALLLPFAAAISALLMAVAIRCKSFKEAQASATVVILVASLLPLASLFNLGTETPWQLWVPALAQSTLMTRVLKGEGLSAGQVLLPSLVCLAVSAAGVAYVASRLRAAAVR